jgi:hypothetical protein
MPVTLLLALSAVHGEGERIGSMSGFLFETLLIAAGFLVYWGMSAAKGDGWRASVYRDTR